MNDILMKEGTLLHSIIFESLNHHIQDISGIQSYSHSIYQATNQYNTKINLIFKNLLTEVKKKQDTIQGQSIGLLNRYLLETLNQLNKKMSNMLNKLNSQIIQPLKQFRESQNQTNNTLLKKSEMMLSSIEANSSFLGELTRNFRLQDSGQFTKQEKQDLIKVYEEEMGKCNLQWRQIKKSYRQLMSNIDSTHSNRVIFLNKIQIRLIRSLNKFLNSKIISDRLIYIEEQIENTKIMSLQIKQRVREQIGKSSLLEQESHQFIIGNQGKDEEREKINDFIQVFTSRSNLKQQEKTHQRARNLILENQSWANYFLKKFQFQLHSEIRLPTLKYHQLTTIMKYLFASLVEIENNQQQIYHILYLTYRISNNQNYIIQQIGKYQQFWNDNQRWYGIIQYIQSLRVEKPISSISYNPFKMPILTHLWNWNKKSARETEKQIKSEKIINDARDFQILCEINYYMSRLKLKNQYIFSFISKVGMKYSMSRESIEKLFKFHYFDKKNSINKRDMVEVRRKRIEEKSNKLQKNTDKSGFCVGKSIKYLKIQPWLLSLRFVCKKWNQILKKKIYKRFLIQEKDTNLIHKIRLNLYLNISLVGYQREVYQRMVKQVPQFTQHTEIISLDARRSLSWDQSLRGTLIQVLKTFSFYHPDVGYLQGMNYLCENILKITDDGYSVYRIFQYLMNNNFFGMYSASFDCLKIKMYQFMRILQREAPKLSDHFEAEKIEGEHFLLSWAITLWGQMSGQLCWIMWDGFMVKGWKWWIKTGVWLLKTLQPQLIQLNFEGMMKCFSELSSTIFSCTLNELQDFGIKANQIKQEIDKISIEEDYLKDLQKQYQLKVSMVKEYMKKLITNNTL